MKHTSKKSIAVLGAGVWGSALANVLAKNGESVCLWDTNADLLKEIQSLKRHPRFSEDVIFNKMQYVNTLTEALRHATDILIAVPSGAFFELTEKLSSALTKDCRILWATKGLVGKGEFLHQIAFKNLGNLSFAVLSGPSFAQEVAKELPTSVVIASHDLNFAKELASRFSNPRFQVFVSDDLVGVQLGGVAKNILAVVAGLSDGLDLGANARAALITRGLAEMYRLGIALSAKQSTLMGLAGCGDAILTCTDNQSRNRRFGLALGQGLSEAQALDQVGQVVEAVYNVEQLYHLAQTKGVKCPIMEAVFRIMKHQASSKETIMCLFATGPEEE